MHWETPAIGRGLLIHWRVARRPWRDRAGRGMVRPVTAMFVAVCSRVDRLRRPVVPSPQASAAHRERRRRRVQGHEPWDAVSAACFH